MKYVSEFEFPAEAGFTGSVQKFAKGGRVGHKSMKQSSQFKMKTTAQDSMDHGVQPAREGRNEAEIEAGGTGRLLPGFKKGGKVESAHDKMYKHGGKMGYKKGGHYAHGGLAGQTATNQRRNTVTGVNKSQGEHVQPAGRGVKHVGKGGTVGAHKGYRFAKKGGKMKKYAHSSPYAKGGLTGQSASNQRRNTVTGTKKSEGESVPAVGRGSKHVGSGGKTGQHKGYRYSK